MRFVVVTERLLCSVALLSAVGVVALARPSAAPTAILMQACRVVPGQTLETFYPVMPGWERGAPKSDLPTMENAARLIPMQKLAAMK